MQIDDCKANQRVKLRIRSGHFPAGTEGRIIEATKFSPAAQQQEKSQGSAVVDLPGGNLRIFVEDLELV